MNAQTSTGLEGQRPTDARSAYNAWHARFGAPTGSDPMLSPWHRLVLEHVPELDGKRVLEVGAGSGEFPAYLARAYPITEFVATDFSQVAVDNSRERASRIPNLRVETADAQALPFGSEAFDVVISCEMLEHLPDPQRAVREMARVLRPNGTLLLTTPNYISLSGLHRVYSRLRRRNWDEGGQPISRVTTLPRTWWWLRRARLPVATLRTSGYCLPVPGRPGGLALPLDRLRYLGAHSLSVATKHV